MKLGCRDLTQKDVDADLARGGNTGQSADLVVNSWPLPLNFRLDSSFNEFGIPG